MLLLAPGTATAWVLVAVLLLFLAVAAAARDMLVICLHMSSRRALADGIANQEGCATRGGRLLRVCDVV